MAHLLKLLADWQFWTALLALVAIVLSQLPPVRMWFRATNLDVEVHGRITVTHKVGNPNLSLYTSISNTGGRNLRIDRITVGLFRNGNQIAALPAQSYFETQSEQSSVLLVPFTLRPDETWGHRTNYYGEWDRTTEKLYRESEFRLRTRILEKRAARKKGDDQPVIAEDEYLKPFTELFGKLFIWSPGEYVVELSVYTKERIAPFEKRYRFTLFESDSAELASHTEDYKYGGGLNYNVERHIGVHVPLTEHPN